MKSAAVRGFVLGNMVGGPLMMVASSLAGSWLMFGLGAINTLLAAGCWGVMGARREMDVERAKR